MDTNSSPLLAAPDRRGGKHDRCRRACARSARYIPGIARIAPRELLSLTCCNDAALKRRTSIMKIFRLLDLGRASAVTASNAMGIAPEGDGSGLRIYAF